MAELTEEQIELAVREFLTMAQGEYVRDGTVITKGLCAAAPYLQLPWEEPTKEEVAAIHWTLLSDGIATFVRRRNAALLPEPVVPGFIECDSCRTKPGSPTLCRGCRHNRDVIEALRRQIGKVG